MVKVVIGFSRPKCMKFKFFAWLIMKSYGTPYSHSYIRIHSEKFNRDLIYQASQTLVNFMGMEVFNEEAHIVEEFEFNISDQQYIEMMQFAIDSAGIPYGLKECFGMAYVRIMEILGKKAKNPFRDGQHTYVCSELVAYILKSYLGGSIPTDYEDMSPLDLYKVIKTIKG